MPHEERAEASLHLRILRGLVDYYMGTVLRTTLLSMTGNVMLTAALYQHERRLVVLAWGAASLCLLGLRIALATAYRRSPGAALDAPRWELLVLLHSLVLASYYVLCLPVLFTAGDHVYNGLVIIWALMMISGTSAAVLAMKRAMLVFCAVLGGGLSLQLAILGDIAYLFVSAGVVLYTLAHMGYGSQGYRLQTSSMQQSILNEDLAARLEQQVAVAREAEAQASRASQEKSRFIAAASHDLRQPLHALALATDAIQRRLSATEHAADVEILQVSVGALSESLDAMLDLSKLDAGAVTAEMRRIELAGVFADLHHTFHEVATARGLTLRFAHRGEIVIADRHLLTRLLGNLIDNAIKYTPQGSILVAVRRRSGGGLDTAIQVRDSGVGIAPDSHGKVFDEFYQVGNADRSRNQGLGLGLSIVRRLATLMQMRLHLTSRPGCGSCFELHCRSADPAGAFPPDTEREGADGGVIEAGRAARVLAGRRLLVVDNEPVILAAITALLRPYDVRIDEARSAEDALKAARVHVAGTYDLVLLDYRIGAAGGSFDLARQITAAQGALLPIVIITGDTDSAEIRALRASGAYVLFKPIRGDSLIDRVCRILEGAAGSAGRH